MQEIDKICIACIKILKIQKFCRLLVMDSRNKRKSVFLSSFISAGGRINMQVLRGGNESGDDRYDG